MNQAVAAAKVTHHRQTGKDPLIIYKRSFHDYFHSILVIRIVDLIHLQALVNQAMSNLVIMQPTIHQSHQSPTMMRKILPKLHCHLQMAQMKTQGLEPS
jgi:hypothetical protein